MKRLPTFVTYLFLLCLIIIGTYACSDKKDTPASDSAQPEEVAPTSPEPMPSDTGSEPANEGTAPMDADSTSMSETPGDAADQSSDSGQAATAADPAPADSTASAGSDTSANSDMLALAKTSGCLACHAVDKKIVGPAWKDVAARYKNDPGARNMLIEKVKKGGTGNWKDVVGGAAMPPYFPRVTEDNIGKLVDFVLSL